MQLGQPAPEFSSTTDNNKTISLQQLRGQYIVLYFYPKDSSYGCSIEANKFEQMLPELKTLGATVIGVSTDNENSHNKFKESCNLSFALLSDTDKSISRAYGVMGGITGLLGLADRQTFLIGPSGTLVHHWRRVNPLTHALEVKNKLQELQNHT